MKPKPDTWDSDFDGPWADQPGALIHTDAEEDVDDDIASIAPKKPATRGRGKAAGTTRKTAAVPRKPEATQRGRGKKKVVEEEENEEEDKDDDGDVIMIDSDEDEEDEEALFVTSRKAPAKNPAPKAASRAKSPAKKPTARGTKQSTLTWSQPATQRRQTTARASKAKKVQEPVSM